MEQVASSINDIWGFEHLSIYGNFILWNLIFCRIIEWLSIFTINRCLVTSIFCFFADIEMCLLTFLYMHTQWMLFELKFFKSRSNFHSDLCGWFINHHQKSSSFRSYTIHYSKLVLVFRICILIFSRNIIFFLFLVIFPYKFLCFWVIWTMS